MTNGQLTAMVLAALKVRPTTNDHYPLAPNQLRHLIARAVEDELEACLKLATKPGRTKAGVAAAIRARQEDHQYRLLRTR
jgi:hypothetical protein